MKLKELLERATPRPWHHESTDASELNYVNSLEGIVVKPPDPDTPDDETVANSQLIAHAVNVLPEVVEALERLTATTRTFRNVPHEEQEWTPLDDEALDNAFAVLKRANTIAPLSSPSQSNKTSPRGS